MAAEPLVPTRDLDRTRRDLDERGYPLVAHASTPRQIDAMLDRLVEQAASEPGATCVVPGCHKRVTIRSGTQVGEVPGAVPVGAPAGTGYDTDGAPRAIVNEFWCVPCIRQREMLPMSVRREVIDVLSDARRRMLGFDAIYQGPAGASIGFGPIEPTRARDNVGHRLASLPELHRQAIAAE